MKLILVKVSKHKFIFNLNYSSSGINSIEINIVAEEQFVINEFENTYDELEVDQPLIVDDTYGSLRVISDDVNVRF